MKRALIALVAVGFIVAAISIARSNSGEEDKPSASAASRVVKDQAGAQSEEAMSAHADIAEKVAESARARGQQALIVTLREEIPGDVWTVRKASGKPACITPLAHDSTFIEVTAGPSGPTLASEVAPAGATLLPSGACEATLEIFVPDTKQYQVTIGGAGKGEFEPVDVQNADQPRKVTVAG